MLTRIAGIFLPVFAVVAVGWLYTLRNRPDVSWMNRINMAVLMPALIFSALSSKDFDIVANSPLIAGGIGVIVGSGLLGWPIGRMLRQDSRTWLPPIMFNNCGNMGLPLAYLTFGASGLSAMVMLFVISNLAQFTLGIRILDRRAAFWPAFRNPMVVATFVGFGFALTHPPLPDWAAAAIKMIGDAAIPLMLISLGVRLADARWETWQIGVAGGIARPLAGLTLAVALALLLRLEPAQQGLLILFGCLPPAVLNFMLAEQYGQEPGKVASIVLLGNMMAVAFVPLGLALALR